MRDDGSDRTNDGSTDRSFRCAVLGNAGGGKSVLARRMSSVLDVPLHELDTMLWREGWRSVPEAEFLGRHDELIGGERWVVDGFGTPASIGARIARCTHVVHVDLPIWLHFALAAERQASWRAGELKRPPGGMPTPPPTRHLFEMMWRIHTELAPTVEAILVEAAGRGCRIERIETLERLSALQRDPSLVFG